LLPGGSKRIGDLVLAWLPTPTSAWRSPIERGEEERWEAGGSGDRIGALVAVCGGDGRRRRGGETG
jgi:hypothetical protein